MLYIKNFSQPCELEGEKSSLNWRDTGQVNRLTWESFIPPGGVLHPKIPIDVNTLT